MLEESLSGDFALIKAWKADRSGNLIFRKTAINFNVPMAKAGRIVVAEVEEILEVGEIPPEHVMVPGIYVHRIVLGAHYEKPIFVRPPLAPSRLEKKVRIARRAALEFRSGMYANLGIGLPMLASNYVPNGIDVRLQSENGLLGMGPWAWHPEMQTDNAWSQANMSKIDPEIVNAAKMPVTALPGASYVASDESFSMIRGGHFHVTLLGALQVSRKGDLANWMVPGNTISGQFWFLTQKYWPILVFDQKNIGQFWFLAKRIWPIFGFWPNKILAQTTPLTFIKILANFWFLVSKILANFRFVTLKELFGSNTKEICIISAGKKGKFQIFFRQIDPWYGRSHGSDQSSQD